MRVLVLGSGVIGTASAYYLARAAVEHAREQLAGPSSGHWFASHLVSDPGTPIRTVPARAERIMPTAVLSWCSMAKTGRSDSIAWKTLEGV